MDDCVVAAATRRRGDNLEDKRVYSEGNNINETGRTPSKLARNLSHCHRSAKVLSHHWTLGAPSRTNATRPFRRGTPTEKEKDLIKRECACI